MLSQFCFLSSSSSTSWHNYGNYSNNFVGCESVMISPLSIGLYREIAIAIESEASDSLT